MSEGALTLPNQRHLFDIPDDVVYLNCASLAPQMLSVRAAGEAAMSRNAQPWKIHAEDWFTQVEELRALFAQVINADAESVALIPATSYGLSVAAANVEAKPHDRILLIADDYPSTVYTWRAFAKRTGAEILTVERAEQESWTDAILKVFDQRVKVVSVPNVHWTNGALIDLKRIGQRAREVGATFIVDASQSLGAMSTDVAELRPDYLVTVGYKWLLGPFSVGYMYIDSARRDGKPIEQNWILRADSENFDGLVDYRDEYQPGARRFDVGERTNFTLTPMAIAALKQLLEWDITRITSTLSKITASIERRADRLGLRTLAAEQRGPHMLGIELPSESLKSVAARLAEQNVYVGIRGASMRVSPHVYITERDLDRFFNLLKNAL
ncbi:aminotransferase class V-fold PLP-dependent enzyme [Pseudomonas cavernicola]|uniref:Aminotransferase class V-fold PLP-dependent enzyme n=1 Tax=Pseudomonas cavernicola TaxID=2320866 RepID=A0A418XJK2_9PSED|nr:aminotransferase class V-fold PLP-dependent enzyme [Pseudomonas cavernicola]RJG12644.1 aminotransferase class V-fold PLP-dependent enzyme [Pseudomonas cavernicola]